MKIAITGATGFIGKELTSFLQKKEYVVLPVTRSTFEQPVSELSKILEGTSVVINLAGAPIVKKWTDEYKEEIINSRIGTTSKLINAIRYMDKKPTLFISTSAIGIYDSINTHDESSTDFADDFLGNLCKEWEFAASNVQQFVDRLVIFRFGLVLGKSGGSYQNLEKIFRLGLGGRISTGEQAVSFIHIKDLLNAYQQAITNLDTQGIYNLTAPKPINNIEFTKVMGRALNRPTFVRPPICVLKQVYGEGSNVLTSGQRVIPKKLLNEGFEFQYPTIEETVKDLMKK